MPPELRLDHAVIAVSSWEVSNPFYRDVLGFGVSDIMERPFGAAFFHVNPRQHSFAMLETGATLRRAILQIVLADLSMSLDNVLAVAGAAVGSARRRA